MRKGINIDISLFLYVGFIIKCKYRNKIIQREVLLKGTHNITHCIEMHKVLAMKEQVIHCCTEGIGITIKEMIRGLING